MRAILERLESGWRSIVELCLRYDAAITCVVKSYGGDRPLISFDKDTIKKIAELNADLDVDLYILS